MFNNLKKYNMSLIGGILASVASSLISDMVSSSGNKKKNAGTNIKAIGSNIASSSIESAFNERQAKMSHQRQLDFWRMQNAYNLPSEQRKRIEGAGLNAALMYQGGGVNNTAGLLSSVPDNKIGHGDQLDFVGKQLAVERQRVENENIVQNTRLQEQDAKLRERDIAVREKDALLKELEIVNQRIANETDETKRDILKGQADELVRSIKLQNDKLEQETNTLQSQEWLNFVSAFERYERGLSSRAERSLISAQISELATRMEVNKAQATQLYQLAANGKWEQIKLKFNHELRKMGIDPDNHTWQSQLARIVVVQAAGYAEKSALESIPFDYPDKDKDDAYYSEVEANKRAPWRISTYDEKFNPRYKPSLKDKGKYSRYPYRSVWN